MKLHLNDKNPDNQQPNLTLRTAFAEFLDKRDEANKVVKQAKIYEFRKRTK